MKENDKRKRENMYSFFQDIELKDKKNSLWPEFLDWIFSPHFNGCGWTRSYVARYTKAIKRKLSLSLNKKNYFFDSAKNLSFPKNRSRAKILILSAKGDGEGKDLLRHIRNGIAHCNAKLLIQKGEPYVDFMDFMTDGKSQTAYIHISVLDLFQLFTTYMIVEKAIKNNKR